MQNRTEGFLRAINNQGKYNILTFPCHERFQSNWASMPHTFYLWQSKGIKPWVSTYAQLPDNHILLDGSENQLTSDIKLDIILSQNKWGQFPVAKQLAQRLNLPLISIEHTLPTWPHKKQTEAMTGMRGDLNIFISDISVDRWLFDTNDPSVRVIEHAVDTEKFKPDPSVMKERRSINIANDLLGRNRICGYEEWDYITKGFSRQILGDSPGLSKPAENIDHLVKEYQKSAVMVSTTLISPIPTVVLESMAVGLPVICLDNCLLPDVVKDGYNGFISNDLDRQKKMLKYLLENPDIRHKMGENARKTVVERFSLEKHLKSWMNLFDEVVGRGHKFNEA